MTISEMANKLGVSAHTLRYYEKIGLIRNVERANGRRVYMSHDVTWLEFIMRLKQTGMPLAQIQQYAALRYQGETTISERKAMLLSHRRTLQAEIKTLQDHLNQLDQKITIYEDMENEYESLRKGTEKAGGN